MTDYTYHDLKSLTVARLRELCSTMDHEAIKGYTQLHKNEIIRGLCEALGIDEHEHHDVVGINKVAVKAKIAEWKQVRIQALEANDHDQLKRSRTKIRRLKRKIRRATV